MRLVLLVAALVGCSDSRATCSTASDCPSGDACAEGYCATPTSACASGFRWPSSGQCVPVDAVTDLAGTVLDFATPIDLAPPCGAPGEACCQGTCNAGAVCTGPQCESAVAIAVGSVGGTATTGSLYKWGGTSWAPDGPFQAPQWLSAVHGTAPTDVWAVGSGGLVMHRDAAGWTTCQVTGAACAAPASASNFSAAFAISSSDAWIAGSSSAIYHYDGSTWASQTSGIAGGVQPLGIWASSGADVWMVFGKTVAHWHGGPDWTIETVPVITGSNFLLSVYGFSTSDVWVCGGTVGSAAVAHWDGTQWTVPQVTGLTQPGALRSIWGARPDDIWAVGNAGLAVHWDGQVWHVVTLSTSQNLRGVYGAAASDVWAVGDAFLAHWDGRSWSPNMWTGSSAVSHEAVWVP